jgi:hypothetical protein
MSRKGRPVRPRSKVSPHGFSMAQHNSQRECRGGVGVLSEGGCKACHRSILHPKKVKTISNDRMSQQQFHGWLWEIRCRYECPGSQIAEGTGGGPVPGFESIDHLHSFGPSRRGMEAQKHRVAFVGESSHRGSSCPEPLADP